MMFFSLVSLVFFVFFGITVLVYYWFPRKCQWIYLLLFSILFFLFSSERITILYILISACLTFLSTTGIAKQKGKKSAKGLMILGIVGNVLMLAALKYLGFVIGNINSIARVCKKIPMLILIPEWVAPIGISFYTLSAIGYVADCYWGVCEPSGNFFKDLLFISYWPVLTSGPILKYSNVSQELFSEHGFDIGRVCFGIQRMLWGIIKKIVISSRLGVIVDTIYGDTILYNGLYIWIAAILWVFQLYTDFSGCMDIVLGVSECYGIILPENFRSPLFAKNIQEFWQRWHITLGDWYREYILYPLLNTKWLSTLERNVKKKHGRKKGRVVSSCLGMLFVWLLFGLWHGGKWKFVAMGLYFWVIIAFETITNTWFEKKWKQFDVPTKSGGWKFIQCLKVFFLVTIGFVFFRAQNVKTTIQIWKQSLCFNPWIFFDESLYDLGLSRKNFAVMIIGLLVLLLVSLYQRKEGVRVMLARQPILIRWSVYMAMLFVPIIFGVYGPEYNAQDFIYGGF